MSDGIPRLARWLLERLLPHAARESLLGDLHERFLELRSEAGTRIARRWYRREAVLAMIHLATLPREHHFTPPSVSDRPMTTLFSDVRHATRQLRRRPAFTALVVGTLALGISAATAIFSAIYPILLAPLPYPHANQIVMISERAKDGTSGGIGYATVDDIARMNHSLQAIAGITGWGPTLTGRAEPERLTGENVSATFFGILGVAPALGRDFRAEEDVRGVGRVAILSHALWRDRFGADPALVGKSIVLDGTPFTVVGVMPEGFENLVGPQAQIWTTLRYNVSLPYACRTCHHVRAIARLKPNVTPAMALSDLNVISARLIADHPSEYATPGMIDPTLATTVTSAVRPALFVVFGAVMLLLLIACANATNLLLARGAQRRGEFAVRAALGAGRGRIVRQLLTESLLLSLSAGVLGVILSIAGVRALVAIAPPQLPRLAAIHVSVSVLVFALTMAMVIGVVFGLLPALHTVRGDLYQTLKHATRRGAGTRRGTRGALVIVEVALALMLLVGSGLMLRTMDRVLGVSTGFDPQQLLTVQVQTTGPKFNDNAVTQQFFRQTVDAVRALPGVMSAGMTSQLPLSGEFDGYGVHLEAHPNPNPENDPSAFRYAVTPGYLEAMKIPLRRGRLLQTSDGTDAPPVAIINETFAHKQWPGQDPIGQRVRVGAADSGPWFTIVGIVGDVRQVSLATDQPLAIYLPEAQWAFGDGAMTMVVRTSSNPAALAPAARNAIWSVDRNQPITRVATMQSLVTATEAQRHFILLLFATFATVALLLAAAGIYGVLAGTVVDRTAEIGVRSALGASRPSIIWLVVRHGLALAGAGLAFGALGAVLLSRLMQSLLYGIDRVDPVTYAAVTIVLGLVALGASWIPAWRAARVDPVGALRGD